MFETVTARESGSEQASGFVMRAGGCGLEVWNEPAYPPEPRGQHLRDVRRELGVTLGKAARALGLTAVLVGELERGRQVFLDPCDWSRAEARIAASAGLPLPTEEQLAAGRRAAEASLDALAAKVVAVVASRDRGC